MRTVLTILLLLIISVTGTSQQRLASKQAGKVVAIIDGDTFDMLVDGITIRVRMNGIDAPEKKQDYYTQSKKTLATLAFGKQGIIVGHGYDRYRRLIADLFVNNENINYKMVELGMAWHFKKYSSDQKLAAIETTAKAEQRGLWAMQFPIAPWQYRAFKKKLPEQQ